MIEPHYEMDDFDESEVIELIYGGIVYLMAGGRDVSVSSLREITLLPKGELIERLPLITTITNRILEEREIKNNGYKVN